MKIAQSPSVVHRPLKPGQKLVGLDELLAQGTVDSYQRTPQGITALSTHVQAQQRLAELQVEGGVAESSWKGLAKNFILPGQMNEKCAPEYLRHRGWALAAGAISGVLGFMMTAVSLDSVKASFSTSEKAAMAAVITGSIGKATQMAGWSLARRGDSDPKSSYLLASTIGSLNCLAGLSILAALPQANLAVSSALSLTGTLGGLVGAAAGINIFNHLASGPNKGEVATKNGNQDLLVSCLGMPGGLLMSGLARGLGVNPALFAACTLGPALLYCTARAATSLRMNAIDQAELKDLLSEYARSGQLKEAPATGLVSAFRDILKKSPSNLKSSQKLEDFAEPGLLQHFRGRPYLLNEKDGKVMVALRKDATPEQAVRALAHAYRLEETTGTCLLTRIRTAEQGLPQQLPGSDDFRDKGWNLNLAHLGLNVLDAAW